MKEENHENKMPDFDRLEDRIIAEAPQGPFLGIRTNLDPENPEEFNPYREAPENKAEKS